MRTWARSGITATLAWLSGTGVPSGNLSGPRMPDGLTPTSASSAIRGMGRYASRTPKTPELRSAVSETSRALFVVSSARARDSGLSVEKNL